MEDDMKKSEPANRPHVILRTYADLGKFTRAFAEGHFNLIVVVGKPGLGKTREFMDTIGTGACIIDGNATAYGIYRRLYETRDLPLIIDDVDSLHRDRDAVRLLKTLCQSEPTKTIRWTTGAQGLDRDDIPREFTTSSKVAIIANEWRRINVDVAALEDRGHLIFFEPSGLEVHQKTAGWFSDQEVFDFIGSHLWLIEEPSFRHYVRAAELKEAGLDWKRFVLARCISGKLMEVAQLKADTRYASEHDRMQAFVHGGHGCRATYFTLARKLRNQVEAPRFTLKTPSLGSVGIREPRRVAGSRQRLVNG
jgi:hypothetical protein